MLSVHAFSNMVAADAESIKEALKKHGQGYFYIGFSHPVSFVASRLQNAAQHADEQVINKLLGAWQVGIEHALEAQRKNRRVIRLVCLEDLIAHPTAAEKLVGSMAKQLQGNDAINPQWLLLAEKAVRENFKAESLLQQLQAATLPTTGSFYHPPFDTQAMCRELAQVASTRSELEQLQSENKLLQQQLEHNKTALSDSSDEIAQLKEQKQLLQDEKKQLQSEQSQNDEQLQQVQRDLEAYFEKYEDSEKALNELTLRLRETEQELHKALDKQDQAKTRIKELHADLGQCKEKAKSDRALAKEQKTKLQEQLFATQNLLEKQVNQQTDIEAEVSKAKQDAVDQKQRFEKEKGQLIKQLNDVQRQLKQANKDNALLQKTSQSSQAEQDEILTLNRELLSYQQRLIQLENKNSDLEQHINELKTQVKNAEQQAQIRINHVPAVVESSAEKVVNQKRSLSQRVLRKLKLSKQKPSRQQQWLNENVQRIASSPYFDADWYLSEYPDLAEAGVNPAEHYLRFGGFENRNPSPYFDSEFYINANEDVKNEGINPLLHFLLFGEEEGRPALPEGDEE